MKKLNLILLLSVLVISPNKTFSQSQKPGEPSSKLDEQVKNLVTPFKGKVSLYAKNLDTGETYALNGDERVRTASTIKIAVMIEAFARVSEGKAKWTDEVILTKEKKVSGSGILFELSDNLHLTLRDAVNLMMMLSDNTATNLVLDVLTTDAVNARMESLGFKQIKINRKIGSGGDSAAGRDPENKKYGLGFATPHEMVQVMEKLERGEIISPAVSKEMIELMKKNSAMRLAGQCRMCRWPVSMAPSIASEALSELSIPRRERSRWRSRATICLTSSGLSTTRRIS
jgi:beta-lactamase class A